MAKQVFEVEVEVPDDFPTFKSRLEFKSRAPGDFVFGFDGVPVLRLLGEKTELPGLVAVPVMKWRPAKPSDLADQLLGKKLRWRFKTVSDRDLWVERTCMGYCEYRRVWVDANYESWGCAEVLDVS